MAEPKPDRGPNGGAAFPRPYSTDEHYLPCNTGYEDPGMTLRDYFAGQAMAGLLSDSGWADTEKRMAELSYRFADAMIAARDA